MPRKDERLLRVGVLGCGPISQCAHLESAQKGRNATLYAVCDADEGLARRFGTFYDAEKIYLDYETMLADPAVEAVIIGTSDAFHVPAAFAPSRRASTCCARSRSGSASRRSKTSPAR